MIALAEVFGVDVAGRAAGCLEVPDEAELAIPPVIGGDLIAADVSAAGVVAAGHDHARALPVEIGDGADEAVDPVAIVIAPVGDDAAGGPPIAVAADSKFETATVHLEPGCRALMVSDGISEQPARSKGKEHGEQFGRQRVQACMQSLRAGADEVANLFEAVQTHAGTTELADDATVVVVRW